MTVYVNINRNIIASNKKHGTDDPPITCRTGKNGKPSYGDFLEIDGYATMTYDPTHPLPCGATVWLEVDDGVVGLEDQGNEVFYAEIHRNYN